MNCEDSKEAQEFLLKQEGKIFIDIGAHLGYYAFRLTKRFEKVYAIEAFPPLVEILRKLKERTKDNIEILGCAISNREGKVAFHLSHRGPKCHSLVKVGERKITVPCKSLAELFPNTKIDLIKVDVEGSEFEVVLGADLIMNNIRIWFIEMHDIGEIIDGKKDSKNFKKRCQVMEKLIRSYGYDIKWISKWLCAWRRKE